MPFVVILRSTIVALILAVFWPVVQTGINNLVLDYLTLKDGSNSRTILVWYFRTSSLPFGLPHMLTIQSTPQLGGTYEVLTGAAKGTTVFGQDPLWQLG